jgi:hypothetical protein
VSRTPARPRWVRAAMPGELTCHLDQLIHRLALDSGLLAGVF